MKDAFFRACERKKTLAVLLAVYAAAFILGIVFVRTPAFYAYHIELCDRYINRVVYSDRSVFTIFLERTAGCALLITLTMCSGIHVVGLIIPPPILVYRAYTFGGSIAIFFSVYKLSGAIVVFLIYLPIRLLTDCILLAAISLTFARAPRFRFAKCDFCDLGFDLLALILAVIAVCFLEMCLLLVIFHPIGNLM